MCAVSTVEGSITTISRRQFFKYAGLLTGSGIVGTLLSTVGVQAVSQLEHEHPQKRDLFHAFWQELPFLSEYQDQKWNPLQVVEKVKNILPAYKPDGDAFIFGAGVDCSGSETPFPYGSLVKVPIAVDAIARKAEISQTDLYRLVVSSSGEIQQQVLNTRLVELGFAESPKNRLWLTKQIVNRLNMLQTDANITCMADYQRFWQSLVNHEILTAEETKSLLELMSAGKCGGSGHLSIANMCVIPTVPELTVSGKIGIIPCGPDENDMVYSEIWSIYKGLDFSHPIVSAGAFFRQCSKMPDGQALVRMWHLHQLTTALALQSL